MDFWTFYLDISGRVVERDQICNHITVAGIAVREQDKSKISNLLSSIELKWRDTTPEIAKEVVRIILDYRLPCMVLKIQRLPSGQQEFFNNGNNFHDRMAGFVRKKVSFVKPGTVARYRLLMKCASRLIALCLKVGGTTKVLDSDGKTRFMLKLVHDLEIQDSTSQQIYLDGWSEWAKTSKLRKMQIVPQLESIEFRTLQRDPMLLLPDYIAGCFHCSENSSSVTIPAQLSKEEIKSLVWNLQKESALPFQFHAEDFAEKYPLSFEGNEVLLSEGQN